jgi:murein L,D-transpeptidase YcbB/YkuD
MDGLIRAIHTADQEGLDPADYGGDELGRIRQSFDVTCCRRRRPLHVYLSARVGFDTRHDQSGIDDPQWHAARRTVDVRRAASRVSDNRIADSFQTLAPTAAQYQGLKHQLALARQNGSKPETLTQIAMNMDRWRWLPDDLGSRYLLVNIPAFRLDAIENGKSVLAMDVVTGKKDSPTPVLADEMTTVVFSP